MMKSLRTRISKVTQQEIRCVPDVGGDFSRRNVYITSGKITPNIRHAPDFLLRHFTYPCPQAFHHSAISEAVFRRSSYYRLALGEAKPDYGFFGKEKIRC